MRARAVGLALVAVLGVVAGCGRSDPGVSSQTTSLGPRDSVPGTVQADVLTIDEPTPGRFTFVVATVGSGDGCVDRPRLRPRPNDPDPAHLQAVYDTNGSGACRERTHRVVRRTVLTHPRRLVVNDESWRPGPRTSWVRCDTTLGCTPPADRCARAWIDELLARSDLPTARRVEVISCGAGRLVLQVDAAVSGCQGVDGATPPPGCAGSGVHRRWVATLDADRRWQVVSTTD